MDTSSNSSVEKCNCDNKPEQESDSSNSECSPVAKDKKLKISLPTLGFNLRRGRSKRNKKTQMTSNSPSTSPSSIGSRINSGSKEITKKSPKWGIKFNCTKKEPKVAFNEDAASCCKCTCYRKTDETEVTRPEEAEEQQEEEEKIELNPQPAELNEVQVEPESNQYAEAIAIGNEEEGEARQGIYGISRNSSCICIGPWDMQWLRTMHEDCDEAARLARAREIEQGVEAPVDYRPFRRLELLYPETESEAGTQIQRRVQLVYSPEIPVDQLRALFQQHVTLKTCPRDIAPLCHTQVDFIHCLVPDLREITARSCYWGKMDRYEAERLLDGRPEGTFLLRDSAQEEFLFSVSFRKYNRSLHARIEQWNHKFSFDSHDPGVYNSNTVCGLIDHYKDPTSFMFFEPMLTWPLHRNTTFSLQHLCRATIVDRLTYDNINQLQLPKTLKSYLKEYHYRQKIRVNRVEDDLWLDVNDSRSDGSTGLL